MSEEPDPQSPPPHYCPVHLDGTTQACPPCGAARQRLEAWEAEQRQKARIARQAEMEQLAADRRAAIEHCGICDSDGYVGGRVCDHVDRTHQPAREAAMAALRSRESAATIDDGREHA